MNTGLWNMGSGLSAARSPGMTDEGSTDAGPPALHDGFLHLSDKPGFGLDPDWDFVEKYRVKQVPYPLTAFPAQAGIHFSTARTAEEWSPAFAGTAE